MAKKSRTKVPKKAFSKEDLARAAGVAAGLEASFTVPAPPGAMAPAPLLDEIREMGEVGVAGLLQHLSSTAPAGRVPTLLAIRELGDASVVERLASLVRAMRWSIPGLEALLDALAALDANAPLPEGLSAENLARAREVAQRLGADALGADAARALVSSLGGLPPFLQEVALRDGLEAAPGARVLDIAGAMAAEGAPPPAHFVEALAQLGTQEAARALQDLAASTRDKEALSRIRKAAFRLRSRGVEVESAPEEGAAPAHRSAYPDYAHAVVSAVDGRGQMLLWLARSRVPRGRYLVQARLQRGRGIVEFTDAEIGAKELRGVFERIGEIPTLATQEAPAAYAVWLLARAQRENEAGDAALPRGFTHAKLMLDPLADAEAYPPGGAHPLRAVAQPLAADAERVEARTLFAHKPFWTWMMDEERVAPYFQEFVESLESRVAMDEQQQQERLRGIVEKGAREIFADAALRARVAGQLEDNGYVFHLAGDEGMARECVTLADEVGAEAEEPAPLLVEMVQYSINVMLERIVRQAREAQGEAPAPEETEEGDAPAGEEPLIITP